MDVDDSSTPPAESRQSKGKSAPRAATASQSSQTLGRRPDLSAAADRLMVTNLVLENFKSYAGVQEIGPLHQCFTAVVGPNGSGKSNVIDAILFVFGHQAKKLRHARLSELIHKSENHPNCAHARVSVHFQRIKNTSDDGSSFEIMPGSQFIVSRTAYQDNSSQYHVDSKKVSRGEVVDLLKKHGIDLDNNRFLILQGEVEHIATMKPKAANPGDDNGLLEYLEDIIGSNVFVQPIADATKELETLSVERTSRLNRFRIVEREKVQMEAVKIQAEEHISRLKTSYDKKAMLYQHERWRVRSEADKVEVKHHELMTEQAAQKKAEEERDATMKELEAKVSAQLKEVAAAEAKLNKVKSKVKGYENEDAQLQESVKALIAKQKKMEKSIATEETKIEEKRASVTKLTSERTTLEKKVKEGEEELAAQEERLQKLREKMATVLAPLAEKMAAKQRELMPFQEALVATQSQLDIITSKLETHNKRTAEAETALATAQEQHDAAKKRLTAVKQLLQQHTRELQEQTRALTEAEAKIKSLKADDAQLSQRVISTRALIEESNQNKAQSGLLPSLRRSLPPKVAECVLGKLGELGTIDEKYDTAVTTACHALENIVVTTTDVAQQCVDVLKTKKLGRATFIILAEIQDTKVAANAPVQVPEGAKRLFDLVTPDSEDARVAFYHALQDTLVCENLDTASTLAFGKKRWRVVTTSGALFDFAGTISGGGQHRASGGMRVHKAGQEASSSASVSRGPQHNLAELQATLADLNQQLKAIRGELQQSESMASQLKNQVNKLTRQVDTETAEVQSAENQVTEMQRVAAEAKEELESRQREQTDAEKSSAKETAKLTTKRDEVKQKAASGEEAVAKLKKQIDDASGKELRAAEQRHTELQNNIDDWTTTSTKHGVQITSAEKAVIKAEETIKKSTEELATIEADLKKAREQLNTLTDTAMAAIEHQQNASNLLDQESKTLKTMQDEFETLKTETLGNKEKNFKADEKLKAIEAQLKEQRDTIALLSMKIEDVNRKKGELRIDEDETGLEVPVLDEEALEALDDREIKATKLEINRLQAEIEGGVLNIQAILDYREKLAVYMEQKAQVDEINEQFEAKHRELDNLRKQRLDMFMDGHSKINPKLKEMYTMITISGSADLEIANSTDPFLDGITFSVRPPNKSWRPIQNLSGGEKTLSSLALVFALHYYKPTPLYVMDEIDAALDFKNVSIVANYIKERTKDAQFLIVSLRNFMFELADRLVGIYKTDNATKSVTINPSSFALSASSTQ